MSFDLVEIRSSLGKIETSPKILFDDDDGRISDKTGINKIHRADVTAYELSVKAAKKLDCLPLIREHVRYLIYVTQSPTYLLPNHASRLQNEIGISKSAMCFDINQGCSGFVQALVLMNSLLRDSQDIGLIICADTYSKHLSPNDRSTQVLFSDGATATVIKGGGRWEVFGVKHLTDGAGADLLSKNVDDDIKLFMDGAAVFQWTRREVGKQVKALLAESNFDINNIDRFYLHQASKLVINNVVKSLGVDKQRVPTTLHITGNLVSSSIPFLIEQNAEGFNASENVIISGFGVGLSSSSCLLRNRRFV